MKAILLTQTHQPIHYTDLPTPEAGPGEVLIQLRAAALNHRDVFIQQGLYPGITLPVVLGSDGAGVVVQTGADVDPAWQGQAVIINCSLHWGDNPDFYGPGFRILGMPDNGTFAEYVSVNVKYVHRKPPHLSFEQAAALPLAGLTAWRALMSRARLRTTGSDQAAKVLVTGIGGGAALFALQFAVASGAEVWVTSGAAEKLEKALELGAAGGVNYRDTDWAKQLMVKTGGGRNGYFNIIIDSAGGPGFARLIDVAAPGGRIAIFGGTTGNITDLVPPKLFFKQLTIAGSTMGTEQEFSDMLDFVTHHQLVPIVDKVFPLAEADKGFRRMEVGQQFGKVVFKITE